MLCQAYDRPRNKITNDPRFNAAFAKQPHENIQKIGNFIKSAFSRKKGLRVLATNSRTPLTGRAETLQRDAERTRRKRRRRQTGRETETKIRGI